ncbi:lysophospholipase L1-like esterase [Sphingomonas insulae]|nr:SGNH/GDSL hydrolase family protein [Sphingomonas insulae]NIJ31584.1 lysophospholipase L1-like esterase [Sphingomonas insulae]
MAAALTTSPAGATDRTWAGAWGYAAADPAADARPLPPGTYRYRATITQKGDAIALTFSNPEPDKSIAIQSVQVALARQGTGLDFEARFARPVSISGLAGAVLLPGRSLRSDAIDLPVEVGSDVIVAVTFATPTRPARTNLGWPMDFSPAGGEPQPLRARPYLTLVTVAHPRANCTIVAFGDSITDGYLSRSTTVRGWPGRLADRLSRLPATRRCGVVNMGISGNRILRPGRGAAALDRFANDVLAVPGVTHVVVLEGINDIGNGVGSRNDGKPASEQDAVTAGDVVAGYRQIVARAHASGITVIGATMTPAKSAAYMSPAKEAVRLEVNRMIRSGTVFDAVVDFDAAVRDPQRPGELLARFDPGDHLHPNDAGLAAMGDAIDLRLFTGGAR